MDVNNLNQAGITHKVPKTDAERERLTAFNSIAKQEQNFAELIKAQTKSDVTKKGYFNGKMKQKIETAYDKEVNVLFKKYQTVSGGNEFEKDFRYYEYTDKKTGNHVCFTDLDNDGKMDHIRILIGDKVVIDGQDIDDDGIFDEAKITNLQNNIDKVSSAKKNKVTRLQGDDGKLPKEVLLEAAKDGYDKGVSKMVDNNKLIPESFKSPLKKVSNLIKKPAAELTVFLVKNFDK